MIVLEQEGRSRKKGEEGKKKSLNQSWKKESRFAGQGGKPGKKKGGERGGNSFSLGKKKGDFLRKQEKDSVLVKRRRLSSRAKKDDIR